MRSLLRTLRRATLGAVVVAALGTATGYVWAASTTLPTAVPVTAPASGEASALAVIRYVPVPPPAGVDCGALLYVARTATVSGVTSITTGCVDPATLAR